MNEAVRTAVGCAVADEATVRRGAGATTSDEATDEVTEGEWKQERRLPPRMRPRNGCGLLMSPP